MAAHSTVAGGRRLRYWKLAPLWLAGAALANLGGAVPAYQFYVTDVPQRFQQIGERFLGRTLEHVHVVKW